MPLDPSSRRRISSLNYFNLSDEEREAFQRENADKLSKYTNSAKYGLAAERLYNNQQFIKHRGIDEFNAMNDGTAFSYQQRNEYLRDRVIRDIFSEKWKQDDDFNMLALQLDSQGMLDFMESDYMGSIERNRLREKEREEVKGINTDFTPENARNPFLWFLKSEYKEAPEENYKDNLEKDREIREKLFADTQKRREDKVQGVTDALYNMMVEGDNQGIKSLSSHLEEFEALANKISPYYQAFKDSKWLENYNNTDKLRDYAKYQALQESYGPAVAQAYLNNTIQNKIAQEQDGSFTGHTLGRIWSTMWSDLGGAASAFPTLFETEERKAIILQGKDPDNPVRDENGQIIVDENGNPVDYERSEDKWLNPAYWNAVQKYNVFDMDEIRAIEERGGVSPYINVREFGHTPEFWSWESMQEMSVQSGHIFSALVEGMLTKGALRGTGKVINAGLKAAGASARAMNATSKAGSIFSNILVVGSEGISPAQMEAMGAFDESMENAKRSIEDQKRKELQEYYNSVDFDSSEARNAIDKIYNELKAEDNKRVKGAREGEKKLSTSDDILREQAKNIYTSDLLGAKEKELDKLHAKDLMEASKAATLAYTSTFAMDYLKEAPINTLVQKFKFAKGTLDDVDNNSIRRAIMADFDTGGVTRVVNSAGEYVKRVTPTRVAKEMGKQIAGGFVDEYVDGLNASFGKAVANHEFSNYIDKTYNPEAYSEAADNLFGNFFAGVNGFTKGITDPENLYEGGIGALIGLSVTPNVGAVTNRKDFKNALFKGVDENGNKLNWAERLSRIAVNPLLDSYVRMKEEDRKIDQTVDLINKVVADNKDKVQDAAKILYALNDYTSPLTWNRYNVSGAPKSSSEEEEAIQTGAGEDVDLGEDEENQPGTIQEKGQQDNKEEGKEPSSISSISMLDSKDSKLHNAFTLLEALNTLEVIGAGTESAWYKDEMRIIQGLAEGTLPESEMNEQVDKFLADPSNKSFLGDNYSRAMAADRLKKNAQYLVKMKERMNEIQETFNKTPSMRGMDPRVRSVLTYNLVATDDYKERMESMMNELGLHAGDAEAMYNPDLSVRYATKEARNTAQKVREDKVEQYSKDEEEVNSNIDKVRDKTKELKEKLRASSDKDEREKIKEDIKKQETLIDSYKLQKQTIAEKRQIASTEARDLKSLSMGKEDASEEFTEDYLLALDIRDLAEVLSPRNRGNYSKEQLRVIDNVMAKLQQRDPGALRKVMDAATLARRINDLKTLHSKILNNDALAASYLDTVEELRDAAAIEQMARMEVVNKYKELEDAYVLAEQEERKRKEEREEKKAAKENPPKPAKKKKTTDKKRRRRKQVEQEEDSEDAVLIPEEPVRSGRETLRDAVLNTAPEVMEAYIKDHPEQEKLLKPYYDLSRAGVDLANLINEDADLPDFVKGNLIYTLSQIQAVSFTRRKFLNEIERIIDSPDVEFDVRRYLDNLLNELENLGHRRSKAMVEKRKERLAREAKQKKEREEAEARRKARAEAAAQEAIRKKEEEEKRKREEEERKRKGETGTPPENGTGETLPAGTVPPGTPPAGTPPIVLNGPNDSGSLGSGGEPPVKGPLEPGDGKPFEGKYTIVIASDGSMTVTFDTTGSNAVEITNDSLGRNGLTSEAILGSENEWLQNMWSINEFLAKNGYVKPGENATEQEKEEAEQQLQMLLEAYEEEKKGYQAIADNLVFAVETIRMDKHGNFIIEDPYLPPLKEDRADKIMETFFPELKKRLEELKKSNTSQTPPGAPVAGAAGGNNGNPPAAPTTPSSSATPSSLMGDGAKEGTVNAGSMASAQGPSEGIGEFTISLAHHNASNSSESDRVITFHLDDKEDTLKVSSEDWAVEADDGGENPPIGITDEDLQADSIDKETPFIATSLERINNKWYFRGHFEGKKTPAFAKVSDSFNLDQAIENQRQARESTVKEPGRTSHIVTDADGNLMGISPTLTDQINEDVEDGEDYSLVEGTDDIDNMNNVGSFLENDARNTNLSGNKIPQWDPKELREESGGKGKLQTRKGKEENDSMSNFQNWMKNEGENGIRYQDIIDKELHQILRNNPDAPIRFLAVRSAYNATNDAHMNNHLLLVTDFDDTINPDITKIHNPEYGGVLTSQGKKYLVVGVLGYGSNTEQNSHRRALYNIIYGRGGEKNGGNGIMMTAKGKFFRDPRNSKERFFVHPTLKTKVVPGSLIPGYKVHQLEGDNSTEWRPISELLKKDSGRNPYGFKDIRQLVFGIQEYSTFFTPGNKKDVMFPRDGVGNAGRAFVLIPACNGKKFPVALRPLKYNEMRDGELKTNVQRLLKKVVARNDLEARREAIDDLIRIFHFTSEGNNILVSPKDDAVTVVIDGVKSPPFHVDSNSFVFQDFLAAIERMNPRVSITKSTLRSPARMKDYMEAGAFDIDLATLSLAGSSYSVYSLDKDGKMIVNNEARNTGRGKSELKVVMKQFYYKMKPYIYDFNRDTFSLNGIDIDKNDPNNAELLTSLNYLLRIFKESLIPVASRNGWDYYIMATGDHPEVIRVNDNTYEYKRFSEEESRTIINKVNQGKDAETREKNAQEELKRILGEGIVSAGAPEDVDLGDDLGGPESGETPPETGSQPPANPPVNPPANPPSSPPPANPPSGGLGPVDLGSLGNEALRRKIQGGPSVDMEFIFCHEKYGDQLADVVLEVFGEEYDDPDKLKEFLEKKGIPTTGINNSENGIKAWFHTIRCEGGKA